MTEWLCYLITVLHTDGMLTAQCAIKVHQDDLTDDIKAGYYMEPECREFLHNLLPDHVKSMGPVIHVEEIFEVEVVARKES